MIRICQCGLATDDPGLLEDHLGQYGHRERVPWWEKLTQVILASRYASPARSGAQGQGPRPACAICPAPMDATRGDIEIPAAGWLRLVGDLGDDL